MAPFNPFSIFSQAFAAGQAVDDTQEDVTMMDVFGESRDVDMDRISPVKTYNPKTRKYSDSSDVDMLASSPVKRYNPKTRKYSDSSDVDMLASSPVKRYNPKTRKYSDSSDVDMLASSPVKNYYATDDDDDSKGLLAMDWEPTGPPSDVEMTYGDKSEDEYDWRYELISAVCDYIVAQSHRSQKAQDLKQSHRSQKAQDHKQSHRSDKAQDLKRSHGSEKNPRKQPRHTSAREEQQMGAPAKKQRTEPEAPKVLHFPRAHQYGHSHGHSHVHPHGPRRKLSANQIRRRRQSRQKSGTPPFRR
ncbi:uncharacterized protein GGS25DRAFT_534923 [Hypoxylon fragiforme]|uniref:uncharacterized protein n=1 Tax=Hypoxylon fragiforme TaxID=63214 RepID=UPI0020C63426|nr:uncharacterized protein GGS25DRAFT_534923 [Hypoxylon fragiforme]KAI2604508.1 hypothetical protein GGS25DRAFT_534923 [Hypoxylon fragiforme]